MLPTKVSSIVTLVVAIVAICLVSYPVEARAFVSVRNSHSIQSTAFVSVRGGATALEEEEELEIESSDYEDSDEEEEDLKLAKSTQTKVSKRAKKAVSSTLASTKPAKKTKKSGLLKLFKIPYIVGACLNPIVLVKMITGYWASLVNLEYLKENVDPSENLRTALQEKAKKGGGSSNRGKRKMRPGQAKTLSDLPQLNT